MCAPDKKLTIGDAYNLSNEMQAAIDDANFDYTNRDPTRISSIDETSKLITNASLEKEKKNIDNIIFDLNKLILLTNQLF